MQVTPTGKKTQKEKTTSSNCQVIRWPTIIKKQGDSMNCYNKT